MTRQSPLIWSIAGMDSGGGAGLSADQRAADAFGVHLCPVTAAITAQNTVAVTRIISTPQDVLLAQMEALMGDLPPRVIKTGLLGNADNAKALATWLDEQSPVALVVDPVLRASTGVNFASEELLKVYREELIPRATVITPNRREAGLLLGLPEPSTEEIPAYAQALRELGVQTVCITGGDIDEKNNDLALSQDWLLSPHAQGWLALPRIDTVDTHGTGCTFATGIGAALALGFVSADAVILAKMLTAHALTQSRKMGRGAGPVIADHGFSLRPEFLPKFSLDVTPITSTHEFIEFENSPREAPGLYAIADTPEKLDAILQTGGASTVQLRIKRPPDRATTPHDVAWEVGLSAAIRQAIHVAKATRTTLYINDHWELGLRLGAEALHLGQEDLLSMTPQQHQKLATARAHGVKLGVSSHSLWELCRAHALQPNYIACGPIWPTTTKDMPWRPQGLDNLAWWSHMAPVPVVAIGGILTPEQLALVASVGAQGGCVVRGLGDDLRSTLPAWHAAWQAGKANARLPIPKLPHPSL